MTSSSIHCLYDTRDKERDKPQIRCTCGTEFGADIAAAITHLPHDSQAMMTPLATALSKSLVEVRLWIRQAKQHLDYAARTLAHGHQDLAERQLQFAGDNLARARAVSENPYADERSQAPDLNPTPHTAALTSFCLRCGENHSVDAADQLNAEEGLE